MITQALTFLSILSLLLEFLNKFLFSTIKCSQLSENAEQRGPPPSVFNVLSTHQKAIAYSVLTYLIWTYKTSWL